MDTHHRITKFFSSQKMVYSETQERIFSLGQALVDELKLDPGVDTLSRWIAHYIAEQMASAEAAKGEQKAELEQKCFDLILALWERRVYFPHGSRPFENFEVIFKVIEHLDQKRQDTQFYRPGNDIQTALENVANAEVGYWLKAALGIDSAARILVEEALYFAAQQATDDKALAFLENSPDESEDANAIKHLLRIVFDEEDISPLQIAKRHIESRLERLDALMEYGQIIRASYALQLEELEQGNVYTEDDNGQAFDT